MGAVVDFVQMPNFWRYLQSTPDEIWHKSILTKGVDCDNAEFDFDDQLKLQMQEEDAVIIEEINHG